MRDIGFLGAQNKTAWVTVCSETQKVLKLTGKQTKHLSSSVTARFVYKLPFLASCSNPSRTGLVNLFIYAIEAFLPERSSFLLHSTNHTPSDDSDIFNRLRPFMSHTDSNEKTLKHAYALIALIMLCGYERSREKDSLNGVYNPLNSGVWIFAKKKEELLSIIKNNFCNEVDKELSVEKAMNVSWFGSDLNGLNL